MRPFLFLYYYVEFVSFLVPLKEVAGINFVCNVVKSGIVAVGDDGIALLFELLEVVDD